MGLYVGIDPGKEGFTFEIDKETGRFLRADPQPLIGDGKGDTFDLNAMRERIKRWIAESDGELFVVIEELKAPGGKRGSPQSIWVQALGFAYWRGELAALGVSCVAKPKSHMKKIMGVITPARTPKKPEPDPPEDKRPKKPAKKAAAEKFKAWQEECAVWDKKKAEYDEKYKAWLKADNARRTKDQKAAKLEAIKVAQQYFPSVDFKRTPKCKSPDDNKCEAALYALVASKIDPKVVVA